MRALWRTLRSSPLALATTIVGVGAIASLLSWQSSSIWEESGLGLAFVAPALALVAALALVRPGLVSRHWNRWASLILLSLLAWGALGFHDAASGALKQSSLGGDFGLRIIGDRDAAGALRLAGIGLLAMIFLAPRLAWRLARSRGQRAGEDAWRLACWLGPRLGQMARRMAKAVLGVGLVSSRRTVAWLRPKLLAAATGAAGGVRRLVGRPARPEAAPGVGLTAPAAGASEQAPAEMKAPFVDGVASAGIPRRAEPAVNPRKAAATRLNGAEHAGAEEQPLRPGRIVGTWHLPSLDILDQTPAGVPSYAENAARARTIEEALGSYGIEAKVVEINPGPAVTQFGVEPGWARRYREARLRDDAGRPMLDDDGAPLVRREEVSRTRVKVDAITNLDKDLALALAASSIRIEAPVPGKSIVGIEVPNSQFELVSLRDLLETPEFERLRAKSKLALALGKGASGEAQVADLGNMPHLLIAGATGSGKSICLRAVLVCLLMHAAPEELRLLLIDPKRVELIAFNSVPHLLQPAIVDVEKVVLVLRDVIHEMEERYKRFAAVGARNLESYNRNRHVVEPLPYLVIVVDELADLMMAAPFDVEHSLTRLAQLGRATGIHLVVATQRPSVDVVTGLIKANFPSRISFAVSSFVDSRTILDTGGAEKLLGKGDMLYLPQDAPKPRRMQGVFVSDQEVERLVRAWNSQRPPPAPASTPMLLTESASRSASGAPGEDADPLMSRARELAGQYSRLSASLLQRRLQIGYTKAASLAELLREEGYNVAGGDAPP